MLEPLNPNDLRVAKKEVYLADLLKEVTVRQEQVKWEGTLDDQKFMSQEVEAVLLLVPSPTIYVNARIMGNRWAMDRGSRSWLEAMQAFLRQKIPLSGLHFLLHLEGKTFENLSRPLQRRLEEARVPVVLLEEGTSYQVANWMLMLLDDRETWDEKGNDES